MEEKQQKRTGLSSHEAKLLSPASIVERLPGEYNEKDYMLEISSHIEGPKYIRSWTADFTGRTTWEGMLNPILTAKGEGSVDLTILVEPVDPNVKITQLAHRMAMLMAERVSEVNPYKLGNIDQELIDINNQLARLRINEEKLFHVSTTMSIGAYSTHILRRLSRPIIKRMGSIGTRFAAADTRQLEVWRHAIGIGDKEVIKDSYIPMETSNVADLFMYSHGGLSHRKGILLGFDNFNRPVFFDGWDKRLKNYNMLIFGQSGGGKSFAIKTITRRSAAVGIKTAIVDPGIEFFELVNAMGGSYVVLSPTFEDDEHFARINIYDVEEEINKDGKPTLKLEESIKAVQAVLFKMIRTVDPDVLTGSIKVDIGKSLRRLYKDVFHIYDKDANSLYDFTTGQKKRMPTLTDHFELMKEYPDLQPVLKIIEQFTRGGGDRAKSIFDCESTFRIGDDSVFAISMEDLDEEIMRPIGIFVATKFIWEKFAKKNRKQKKRIIVDEAQEMMKAKEEAIWLEDAYRRGRKLNVSMCAVTQGFEVFLRVEQGIGILKNAPVKLLLKQEPLDIEAVQGKFALSDGEATFLLRTEEGVGILRIDEESSIVRITSTPNEYALYSTNPNDE